MQNLLTIDFEDWFQAEFCKTKISVAKWSSLKSRFIDNTLEILNILGRLNIKATFFVVIYNAKRYPDIIRKISKEGHELALHTYYHDSVYRKTPSEFSDEIDYSKKFIEDISQTKVIGFRAPNWSITSSCMWALNILRDSGFLYDSSMCYSIFRRMYSRIPQGLLEIPRSEFSFLNLLIPFGGGFFLRAYPYSFTKIIIGLSNKKGVRTMTYLHPWEFDKTPTEFRLGFIGSLAQNFKVGTTKRKFMILLEDFKFASIRDVFFGSGGINEKSIIAESARK